MKQVWGEFPLDAGWIEMRDRCMRAAHLDPAHRSKPVTVVETGETGQAVERFAIDLMRVGRGICPTDHVASIALGAEAADRMDSQRLAR
jgi:hypothetical protein